MAKVQLPVVQYNQLVQDFLKPKQDQRALKESVSKQVVSQQQELPNAYLLTTDEEGRIQCSIKLASSQTL